MTLYFIDSSALVKRYINEIGSTWLVELFAPDLNNEFFIAAITSVEVVAAITRRSRNSSIQTVDAMMIYHQLRVDLQQDYQVIEITASIINSGMIAAETWGLRGYDAIQLAVGQAVNALCLANGLPAVTFVSADQELNAAAVKTGLAIENPNSYR